MKLRSRKNIIPATSKKVGFRQMHNTIGALIISILIIYLKLGTVCTNRHRFVEYIRKKCFNSFEQSTLHAARQTDENPNSNVVGKTMTLLADSSYGYQITDRSRKFLAKSLSKEKTLAAFDSRLFKKRSCEQIFSHEFEHAKAYNEQ